MQLINRSFFFSPFHSLSVWLTQVESTKMWRIKWWLMNIAEISSVYICQATWVKKNISFCYYKNATSLFHTFLQLNDVNDDDGKVFFLKKKNIYTWKSSPQETVCFPFLRKKRRPRQQASSVKFPITRNKNKHFVSRETRKRMWLSQVPILTYRL